MQKKVIVSFSSTGRENYNKAQLRLIRSAIDTGWNGDYFIRSLDSYVDEYLGVEIVKGYPITELYGECNPHVNVPYQFKPYIIQEVKEMGYDVVVWCDSTIFFEKNITQLLKIANKQGVLAFDNLGFPLNGWLSDYQQDRLRFTDKELLDGIPQCMGCFLIFDFTNRVCRKIFKQWIEASRDGVSFQNYGSKRRGFVQNRNDQSYLSGLMYKEGIKMLPYGGLIYEPHNEPPFAYGREYFLINKGIV